MSVVNNNLKIILLDDKFLLMGFVLCAFLIQFYDDDIYNLSFAVSGLILYIFVGAAWAWAWCCIAELYVEASFH